MTLKCGCLWKVGPADRADKSTVVLAHEVSHAEHVNCVLLEGASPFVRRYVKQLLVCVAVVVCVGL
jgi:hypothetical protein